MMFRISRARFDRLVVEGRAIYFFAVNFPDTLFLKEYVLRQLITLLTDAKTHLFIIPITNGSERDE